jgi:hydrogenase maturation protease
MDASSAETPRGILIIGYGNTLRGDDGAGPAVARATEDLDLTNVRTLACDLLTPELADPVSRARFVVFVDAAIDPPPEVRLRPLAPAESSQIIAHAADPRTLLALARDVFGHTPTAWWLTIPAQTMGIGEQFSELTQRGTAEALNRLRALVEELETR